MRIGRIRTILASADLVVITTALFGQSPIDSNSAQWKTLLAQRLTTYGHRNWIIVADSAFPAYSEAGIETIVVDQDLPSVLDYVVNAISSSKHVRATAFLDQELQFVREDDYPGVMQLRQRIKGALNKATVSTIPHSEVLSKIDAAGKTFRILFIKTNATVPYTSVYMRLDCGYMTDEVERRIREDVERANR